MPDPITTVVTVISEHPQAAATVASIYGVAKPFLAKILGPSAEEIGEIGRDYIKGKRAKNVERTLADADKQLIDAGREAQEVPLATLVPLLEAASLQDEPSLAERWATLLANAADSAQTIEVKPAYTEILKQLTSSEAELLNILFTEAKSHLYKDAHDRYKHAAYMKSDITGALLDLEYIRHQLMQQRNERAEFGSDSLGRRLAFNASIDNFLRQQLVILAKGTPLKEKASFSSDYEPERSKAFFTSLGYDFMLAVTPRIH